MASRLRAAILGGAALALSSCAAIGPEDPPANTENACAILREKPHWGDALGDAAIRWGAPPHVAMAIIWKESSFRADARTERQYILGIIPNGRRSSAYGYPQAINSTWEWYRDDTGNSWAERNDFEDATDFVGWYMNRSLRVTGIAMDDAYNQYLAYHEGHAGWKRGDYRKKGWLTRVAREVQRKSEEFERQIAVCGT